MKKLINSSNMRSIFLMALLLSAGYAFQACSDKPEEEENEPELRYIAEESVSIVHVKGTDPCPQQIEIVGVSNVSSNPNVAGRGEQADSIQFVSTHSAIAGAFATSNGTSTSFDQLGVDQFGFFFTCDPPQSVNTKVQFKIFKDGAVIKTEEVQVTVTVKE